MKTRLIILVLICLLLIPSVYSLTASIGGGRAIVRVNASPEEPAILERTLLIQNKNEIAIKATVKVDEKFEKFVTVLDKEVVLQPDESKKARYVLTMDRGGSFEIKINVAFEALDPTLKENKVGISATLIVISDGPIIEDPELDGEENVQENVTEASENPYASVENPDFEENLGNPDATDSGNNDNAVVEENKPEMSWLVGIIIILVILGVGLGIFFAVQKTK